MRKTYSERDTLTEVGNCKAPLGTTAASVLLERTTECDGETHARKSCKITQHLVYPTKALEPLEISGKAVQNVHRSL